jgi:hypothetical protein
VNRVRIKNGERLRDHREVKEDPGYYVRPLILLFRPPGHLGAIFSHCDPDFQNVSQLLSLAAGVAAATATRGGVTGLPGLLFNSVPEPFTRKTATA